MITRNLNHPELIFNQNNDSNNFFVQDIESKWKLSVRNECFVCDKHSYVALFY